MPTPVELNYLRRSEPQRLRRPVPLEPQPHPQGPEASQLVEGKEHHEYPFPTIPAAPGVLGLHARTV